MFGTIGFGFSATSGGGGGLASISADNGLSTTTVSNTQLGSTSNSGSPLLHNTFINLDTYTLFINGGSTAIFDVSLNDPKVASSIIADITSIVISTDDLLSNYRSGLDITSDSGGSGYFRWLSSTSGLLTGFYYLSNSLGWTVNDGTTQFDYVLPPAPYVANSVLADISGNGILSWTPISTGTVTSVSASVPSALLVTVTNPTTIPDIAITAVGLSTQYIRGDGQLANFPTSSGGGASVSYYLNGSISQGTFGGVAFREMSRTPIFGVGTDFTINANGYIQSFITDANDPNQLAIPAGNWNFEMYFSASSGGGSPSFYVELYKWDGTTLTLIATSSATPENITGGTAIDLYTTSLAIPSTVLTATDRLAVRVYVTHSGKTITLHTEDSHLCQIITTFSTGLTALNGLTEQVQLLATGISGTDFAINSTSSTHTFNLPTASASNRGALSTGDWAIFSGKQNAITLTTTGTSGAATLVGATLNIPQYSGGGGGITALTGDVTASGTGSVVATLAANLKVGSFGVTIDGVTTVIQVGQIGYVVMPYAGTITGWSITANISGSVSFDVWKAASAIPTVANTIVAGSFPALSSSQFITSTTMTGWTLTFAAGDVFGFYVNSASTIKNATLTLRCTKS